MVSKSTHPIAAWVHGFVIRLGAKMDKASRQKLMDSLTDEQRKGIAEIIRSADVEGDYSGMDDDGGSFWQEDASETLRCLAAYFDSYDPSSALD
jgi:hypothetical protein